MEEVQETSEQESSTGSELEVAETDDTAQSSSAEGETEDSLLDVVQSAMKISDSDEISESPTESEEVRESESESKYEATSEQESSSDDSYSDVPFHEHPRFRELISERNNLRSDSEQYQKIVNFISQNNLTSEDATEAFRVASLIRNDPQQAYDALKGIMDNLSLSTGHTLPEDLQSKVNDGYIDEEDARELSRTRAEAVHERQLREQMSQQVTNQHAQAQHQTLVNSITDWESRTRQTDPDYDLKQPEIDDRVRVLVSQRGRPATVDDALQMANEAYETVNQRHQSRVPEKKPIRTGSGGKLGGSVTPAPKNLLEVIQNTMNKGV